MAEFSPSHSKEIDVSRQNNLRYLLSMIYSILKKDKSSLLGLCEQFLLNRQFKAPRQVESLSMQRVLDSQVICAFNNYLSLINNKKPSKMSCLFDEWDEQIETSLLRERVNTFKRSLTGRIQDIFRKYLQNNCHSLIQYYLQLTNGSQFEHQIEALLMNLQMNHFKGKYSLLELLKQIRNLKLRNPREVIFILAQQRGIILQEDLLALVLEVYGTISPVQNS